MELMAKALGRINHAGHDHPDTSYARKVCRAAMVKKMEVDDQLAVEGVGPREVVGAARERAKAERDDARAHAKVPAIIEDEQPKREPVIRKGRQQAKGARSKTVATFTSEDMRALLEGLSAMEDNLAAVAEIEVAAVTLKVNDVRIKARLLHFGEWSIDILNDTEPDRPGTPVA